VLLLLPEALLFALPLAITEVQQASMNMTEHAW
jgi:hypothetical protein